MKMIRGWYLYDMCGTSPITTSYYCAPEKKKEEIKNEWIEEEEKPAK